MPTYDYQCRRCRYQFEAKHRIQAPQPDCPVCGGGCAKVMLSAPATHGSMAVGREQAIRSLQSSRNVDAHRHGTGCTCGHRH